MTPSDQFDRLRLLLADVRDASARWLRATGGLRPPRRLELSELEERLMLSASPMAAVAVEAAALDPAAVEVAAVEAGIGDAAATPEAGDGDSAAAFEAAAAADAFELPTDDFAQLLNSGAREGESDVDAVDSEAATDAEADVRRELVIVDTSAWNYEELLADVLASEDAGREFNVVLLDGGRDGVEQISEVLSEFEDLDAVHIVSHGTDRAVKLGDAWLTLDNFDQYAESISGWSDALEATDGRRGDLLFYGCNLAGGEDGRALLSALEATCDCDVAASVNDTGAANFGGDWVLEYTVGVVEADVAFSLDVQANWQGLLNTFTVINTNDSGAGSFRQAIIDANALAGIDTIAFNIGGGGLQTIGLNAALPQITEVIIIDATTQGGFAGDPLIELNGGAAGAGTSGLVLSNTADGSDIRGLIIQGFGGDGIQILGDNNTIAGNWIGLGDDGSTALANNGRGVYITGDGNTIGGTGANDGNVISGNLSDGVRIDGGSMNVLLGNFIGTDSTGMVAVGNAGEGVFINSTASANTIGGTSAAARNVVAGGQRHGIIIEGPDNIVIGNYLGVDATGTGFLGNGDDAVVVGQATAANNRIGGTNAGEGNVIGGTYNGALDNGGIVIHTNASGTIIQGNAIGTDATGTVDFNHTGYGIRIRDGAMNTLIGGTTAGAGNIIAFNDLQGVRLVSSAGVGNAVLGNSIHSNGALGIDLNADGVTANDPDDLDVGPNTLQNFPMLASATTYDSGNVVIDGALDSTPNTTFRIEFFASTTADAGGFGEGERYLGFVDVTTDLNGDAAFSHTLSAAVAPGDFISATATDVVGNTSEFSAVVQAVAGNDPPVNSVPGAQTTNEDTPLVFNAANGNLISIGDTDAGSNSIEATLSVGNGALTLSQSTGLTFTAGADGTASMTFTGAIADVNAALDGLTYQPTSNYSGGDTLSITTDDQGNTGTGGALNDSDAVAITVNAVNDAPVVGTTGTPLAYFEDDGAIAVDPGLTVTDVDSATLMGAIVQITEAGSGEDVLAFTNQLGITGSWKSSTSTLTLSGSAGVADYQTALRSVTYEKNSQNPSTALRTIQFVVDDGTDLSAPATRIVEINPVNDAPVLGNNQLTISEGATVTLTAAELSASDVDNADASLTFTVSGVVNGQFELASNPGVAITSFTQAQITAGDVVFIHNGGEAALAYSVTVSDGSLSDGPQAATITFTNVNDAPVLSNNNLTISEDATVTLTAAELSGTDVDNADPSLSFTVSGVANGQFELASNPGAAVTSFTQAQVTAGDVVFIHDGGEAAPAYSVNVSDGSLTDGPQAATVTFTNVNDAPVLDNNQLTISEGATVTLTAAELSATDIDNADPSLTFTVSDVVNGQFELASNPGVAVTSFTQAQITAGDVVFIHNGGEAAPAYRVTVSDGALSDGPQAAAITFTSVNDAPTLGNNQLTISEGATVTLTAAELSGTDVDNADPSLTFTVSGVTNGQFELASNPGAAVTSFTQAQITTGDVVFIHDGGEAAPTYSVTVSDGSLSDGPQAATITFTNVNDAPVLGNNQLTISEGATVTLTAAELSGTDVDNADPSLNFTVSGVANGQFELASNPGVAITSFTQAQITAGDVVFVHDGGENAPAYNVTVGDGALSDGPQAATITFTNVNDAPTLGTNNLTISEGASVTLTAAQLSATDIDNADPSLTFTVSGVVNGQFELASNPGVAVTSFTQAQITAGDVVFIHNGGEAAPAYSVTVGDGSLSDGPQAATITFTNVNDAPTLGNNNLTVSEGATVTLTAAELSATDIDNADPSLTFTVSGVTNGQFELASNPGAAITSFTQSQISAGDVVFIHDGGEAAPTYNVTVSDGSLSDGPRAATITFTNVNDAPVLGNNQLTISEGATVTITAAELSGTDVDNADPSLTFTVSGVTNGQFELASNPGAAITSFTQAQIAAGDVVFIHDGGEVAPAYGVTVSDGSLNDGPHAAAIMFTNVNDAPLLVNNQLTISEGATVAITAAELSGTDVDNADPSLTFTVSGVTNGRFEFASNPGAAITSFTQSQITAGDVVFIHDGGEAAPAYSVTVSDGALSDGPQAAAITFTNVNDAPILGNNQLTINEGATVTLPAAELSATDVDNADPLLTFTVSGVANGRFELASDPGTEITSFTQARITAGDVVFIHDGGEAAPAYSVTVSDGSLSDGPQAATISFTNVNDAPLLGANMLTVTEGETVMITAAELSGSDVDNPAGNLTFTISNLSGGWFELASNPGVAVATFQQSQVTGGNVRFVHDGRDAPPAYDVTVGDGSLTDGPHAANVSFTGVDDADGEIIAPPPDGDGGDDGGTSDSETPPGDESDTQSDADADPSGESGDEGTAPDAAAGRDGGPGRGVPVQLANLTSTVDPIGSLDEHEKFGYYTAPDQQSADRKNDVGTDEPDHSASDDETLRQTATISPAMWDRLDQLQDDLEHHVSVETYVTGGLAAVSTGLTVGYVIWMLRAGSLLASFISFLPAWTLIDPLPVLESFATPDHDELDPDAASESLTEIAQGK